MKPALRIHRSSERSRHSRGTGFCALRIDGLRPQDGNDFHHA
ncbi:MAG: hypothetical protein ACOY82_04645 [Pseudomonadota bacterium]